MAENIINFGALELPIKEIEMVLCEYNPEEQALILKNVTARFNNKQQKQKQKEGSVDIIKQILPGFKLGKKD